MCLKAVYVLYTCCLCVQSELFQDDLYPDTAGDEPSISAEDFFSGKDADPILVGNWYSCGCRDNMNKGC